MNTIPPFLKLNPEQVNTIRQHAKEAESLGFLTPEQLDLIYREQWFKILIPRSYNGLELSLPDVVALEEELSRADGSLGWVVTLCAGAGWFGAFTDAAWSQQIFNDPHVCLAGSGAATGFADIVPDGYLVNGRWKHASGAQHATIFTANCVIRENGSPLKNDDGSYRILSFTFLKNEVSIIPGWPFMGMKATSSHIYEVSNTFVPHNRTFVINSGTNINSPLYQYPFLQLAEATLAVNISGMAFHFLELAHLLLTEKKDRKGVSLAGLKMVSNEFNLYLAELNTARTALYHALNDSWAQCVSGSIVDTHILEQVSLTAHLLSQKARNAVNNIYPYCGLQAAIPGEDINRVWRDIHTAGQHALLVFGGNNL